VSATCFAGKKPSPYKIEGVGGRFGWRKRKNIIVLCGLHGVALPGVVAILHGLLFNDVSSNQRLNINVSGLHCLSHCSGLIKASPLTYFNQLSREGSSGRATFILKFQEKALCQIILPMLQQSPYISYEAVNACDY
jgi:hypothetical protein